MRQFDTCEVNLYYIHSDSCGCLCNINFICYIVYPSTLGYRTNAIKTDFSDILPEEVETELKSAAEISMGTEISEEDLINISYLCDQVIDIQEYRAQLYDYIKNRMMAVAPNLTVLVGELVGARLIAHAGNGTVSL